ncbi:probable extracellular serine proteinase at N-terminal half [Coccomyxa sp. Obi]|nr:probable extracellular serine proteinase at N-terminal half [Coccomyxa sp. Obi]
MENSRATNPSPPVETTITAINIYLDGSLSGSPATAFTNETASTARYAVILKKGFDSTELGPLCDYASKNFGVVCLEMLTNTQTGFLTQATEDRMLAFLAAAGDVINYAREDEHLQLKASEDLSAKALGTTISQGLWGLDRIDSRSPQRDYVYDYDGDGSGVHIYIVDTGINAAHEEFLSADGTAVRILTGFSLDGATPNSDCNGHGTHISGTAAGRYFGVAKNAFIHPLRVIGCDGSGSMLDIITTLEWVHANAQRPAVVLMSLGGPAAQIFDDACQSLVNAGISVIVAAGNEGTDACTVSPARAASVVAVGATQLGDTMTSFSNGGSCVDILAPGLNILSAGLGSSTATAFMSGTSMAAPHVVGAAAIYLQHNPSAPPWQVAAALQSQASWNRVSEDSIMAETPNALLNAFLPAPLEIAWIVNGTSLLVLTDDNQGNGYQLSVQLTEQPKGAVSIYPIPDDQAGRLVMSGTFAANSLHFTPSNWDQPQGLLAAAVKDNAPGDSTFAIRFYVVAPSDPDIDGNFQVFPVVDKRTLPGENADFPLLIRSIPYTGNGTTVGFSQDYQPVGCSGSVQSSLQTAPDVVYAFKPASNCAVSVSLCGSAFDTQLALYSQADDWSDMAEMACNDDYCGNRSYLQAVLSAGSIYYIVISGYQAAAGQYQLDMQTLDGSSVAGMQLRGSYAEAHSIASVTAAANTSQTGVDEPTEPELLIQPWDGVLCPCGAAMLDRSVTCTDGYQLLPLSSCADVSADTARGTAEGLQYLRAVADEFCQLSKPPGAQMCTAESACQLSSGVDCSGNGLCSASAGKCICNQGWQGSYCQTPTDCAGSLDASGNCCTAELSADGMCCTVVDADMACCVSGELDASGACLGAATSIDLQGAPCQGMIDAAGLCCYGVVDAFGVCNGWDASGRIALTLLAEPPSAASAVAVAGYLGIDASHLHSVMSTAGMPASAASVAKSTGSSQQRRMLLATSSATVKFYIDASTTSSRATTSTTLTMGQVEYLLDVAVTSTGSDAELVVLDVAAVAICGNGVCETGERPVANTSSTVGSAGWLNVGVAVRRKAMRMPNRLPGGFSALPDTAWIPLSVRRPAARRVRIGQQLMRVWPRLRRGRLQQLLRRLLSPGQPLPR